MKRIFSLILLAMLATSPLLAGEAAEIGMLRLELENAPGQLDSSGQIVTQGMLTRTLSRAGIVTLDNGQVLRFNANSAAILEALASGEIAVRVLSGQISAMGPKGRVVWGGAGSTFSLEARAGDTLEIEAILFGSGGDDPVMSNARRSRGRGIERQGASGPEHKRPANPASEMSDD